ncbi:hypothetical protein ACSSV4_000616 [Roseovarius sp. MBR-154]|jgi:hypothetical protein
MLENSQIENARQTWIARRFTEIINARGDDPKATACALARASQDLHNTALQRTPALFAEIAVTAFDALIVECGRRGADGRATAALVAGELRVAEYLAARALHARAEGEEPGDGA